MLVIYEGGVIIKMDNIASSSAQMLTSEFVVTLDNNLNSQIARLTASIEEYTARVNTVKQTTMANQLKVVKQLQDKKRDCQKNVISLENNLNSFEQCNKSQTYHVSLLKQNFEAYEKESADFAKDYEETLTNYNNTWKGYEMEYERFPLAIVRKNAKVELQRAMIQLKVQECKLSETKSIIKQRKMIREKRLFNLFVKCAEYWKDWELRKQELRRAMDMQRDRYQELRAKEQTVHFQFLDTVKERKTRLFSNTLCSQLQQLITEKEQRLAEAAASQEVQHAVDSIAWDLQRLKLPEITLSIHKPALVKLQVCNDISDTSSINSTLLDELVGPIELPPKETTASQAYELSYIAEEEEDAACVIMKDQTEAGNDTNSNTMPGPEADDGSPVVSRKRPFTFETESMRKSAKNTLDSDSKTKLREQDNEEQIEERAEMLEPSGICPPIEMETTTEKTNDEQRSEQSDVEKLSAMRSSEQYQCSGPVIKNVDAVKLDLVPPTIRNEEQIHCKFINSKYFSRTNVIRDNDTTSKSMADLFPIPESSREGGSVVGSDASDDMIKQYCVTFSPDPNPGGDRKCVTPRMEDHYVEPPNSNANNNGIESSLGMSFANFDVFGSSIGSRPKPDVNFLNMF